MLADLFGTPGSLLFKALFAPWHAGYCTHGIAPQQVEKDFLHIQMGSFADHTYPQSLSGKNAATPLNRIIRFSLAHYLHKQDNP